MTARAHTVVVVVAQLSAPFVGGGRVPESESPVLAAGDHYAVRRDRQRTHAAVVVS